ncbi:RimJ/RimL family protein N-acetyltransferase [Methanofollis sp. W23]|uniref:GNAT family N-acetyltransferase n=1 Tax=Methanofollis sp. W23 TaxID=2817849 RepID=UPI001AE3B086|nr:GNAT family N-acetyltransferase [Methanofollis sp. W23]MBP2144797.1 RimJ/RimL family protein N-acetyltransferase [Methanofollis sp. W23]
MAFSLQTERLELVPATPRHLDLDLTDHRGLARLLEAEIPHDWPPEMVREARQTFLTMLRADPFSEGWNLWYLICTEGNHRVLIGGCGFVGCPSSEGRAEIGYSLLPEFRGLGYATEAAGALIRWAFDDPEVTCVFARTYPDLTPSIRLLRRLGFTPAGEEEGGIRLCYHLTRATWDRKNLWDGKKEGSIPAFP